MSSKLPPGRESVWVVEAYYARKILAVCASPEAAIAALPVPCVNDDEEADMWLPKEYDVHSDYYLINEFEVQP